MKHKTVQVPNIGCDGCVNTIKSELRGLAGVQSVEADVKSQMVTVKWELPITWETIAAKLAEIDYAPA